MVSTTKVSVERESKIEVLNLSVKLDESVFMEAIGKKIGEIKDLKGYEIKSITFTVPGGGDWSDMSIEIDEMDFKVVMERKRG